MYADIGDRLGRHTPTPKPGAPPCWTSEGVALTPGTDFDRVDGRTTVRVSLAAGPEAVAVAIVRILRFQT